MENENVTVFRDEADKFSDYILLDSRRYDNNVGGD